VDCEIILHELVAHALSFFVDQLFVKSCNPSQSLAGKSVFEIFCFGLEKAVYIRVADIPKEWAMSDDKPFIYG